MHKTVIALDDYCIKFTRVLCGGVNTKTNITTNRQATKTTTSQATAGDGRGTQWSKRMPYCIKDVKFADEMSESTIATFVVKPGQSTLTATDDSDGQRYDAGDGSSSRLLSSPVS